MKGYCPVTSNLPTRMPEASFRRQCETARQATTPHSAYGGRRPINDHCQECRGETLPPGLEFITLAEMVALAGSVAAARPPQGKNKENVMPKDAKPATFADLIPQSGRPPQLDRDVFWALPAGRITLSGLRGYWTNPPLVGRRRGLCPACLVTDQRCKANGVCVTCYDTLHSQAGQALIEAIADAPARKQRALARKAPGRSGLVLQPPDPPPAEEPAPSEIPAALPGPEDYLTAHQPPPAADYIADNTMANAITSVCMDLCEFLLAKNKSYGNSAANPLRIFSQADPIEQINVRIDDKLSRLMRGTAYPGDDTELDLMGYLALKRAIIYRHRNNAEGKASGGNQS